MVTHAARRLLSHIPPASRRPLLIRGMLALALPALLYACGGGGGSGDGAGGGGSTSGGGTTSTGGTSSGGGTATMVTIDPNTQYQTIAGWEATAGVDDRAGEISFQDAVAYDRASVEQVGITRLRLQVRSGIEGQIGAFTQYSNGGSQAVWDSRRYPVVNDNGDPRSINWAGFDFTELDHEVDFMVIPMRDMLAARGEKLFINMCYVSFSNGVVTAHESPAEYAEFALAVMLHLRQKYGLEPDTWEVMLEPDNAKATNWSGQRVGQSIVATAQRFDENAIKAKFVAPSTESMLNASTYFDGILGVSGAVSRMSELSYHRYKGSSANALAMLTQRAQAHGLGISMLEWWFGNATAPILFQDLAAGAVSFDGRVLKGQFVGTPATGLVMEDDVRFNSAVYKAVRPGAVRVGATSTAAFDALAFRRPDGRLVAALYTGAGGSVTIRGLSAGSYTVSQISASGQSGPTAVSRAANGDVSVSASGRAVIVVQPA